MRLLLSLTAIVALTVTSSACTSIQGTATHACDSTLQSLDTGFDHSAQELLEPGDSDSKWIVIRDPDPSTDEPRPATVIGYKDWAPAQPGSHWIGPYKAGTTAADTATVTQGAEVYSYLYCFCLCDRSRFETATISGSLRADNRATIFLNDVEILPQTATNTFSTFMEPVPFAADSSHIRRGLNCLRVDVTNESGGPTGLNIAGAIQRLACCQGRTSRPEPGSGVGDPLGPRGGESVR